MWGLESRATNAEVAKNSGSSISHRYDRRISIIEDMRLLFCPWFSKPEPVEPLGDKQRRTQTVLQSSVDIQSSPETLTLQSPLQLLGPRSCYKVGLSLRSPADWTHPLHHTTITSITSINSWKNNHSCDIDARCDRCTSGPCPVIQDYTPLIN